MTRALLLVTLTFLLLGPAARAEEFQPIVQSCAAVTATGGCATNPNLGGATDLALAPDGRTAYGAGFSAGAVVAFDRDVATGRLTFKSCVSESGLNGCAKGRALDGAVDVEVSADGRNVYVAANSGGIAEFDRATDGSLTQRGCVTFDGSEGGVAGACDDARGLGTSRFVGPFALRLAGGQVYVSTAAGAMLTFDRLAGGTLAQKPGADGCAREDGADQCRVITGLGAIRQFSISPDGRNLYAPTAAHSGIVVFERDAGGALRQKEGQAGCLTSNGSSGACGTEPRLAFGGTAAQLSPDGRHLYASMNGRVVVFERRPDGTLAFSSCIDGLGLQGCAVVRNVVNLSYMGFSTDGEDLAVSNLSSNLGQGLGLVFLHRNPVDGRLSQSSGVDACLTVDGDTFVNAARVTGACRAHPAVANTGQITFADDNQFYAGFQAGSAILAIKREFAPRCSDQSIAVPNETAVSVPLLCSDRNGDPLTVSIVGPPTAGQLGAIDAGPRVFYSPFGGFAGPDSFSYRASAAGQLSSAATVSLSVAPGTPSSGPTGLDGDRDGFFAGQDCNDADASIRPGAREVRGNRVDENCDGLAEPFPTVTSGVSAKWNIDGSRFKLTQLTISNPPKGAKLEFRCAGKGCPLKSKKLSGKVRRGLLDVRKSLGNKLRYRAGQTIQVRIAATGFNTKVAQLKLQAGKIPSVVALCLPPGAAKPQKTCT